VHCMPPSDQPTGEGELRWDGAATLPHGKEKTHLRFHAGVLHRFELRQIEAADGALQIVDFQLAALGRDDEALAEHDGKLVGAAALRHFLDMPQSPELK